MTSPVPHTLDEVVARAVALASNRRRCILGIVGAPGAGKSTLCRALGEALGERVVVVGMDGFHLDDGLLAELGRRERKGAPDTFDVDGYTSLLERIRTAERDVLAPLFDRGLELSRGSAVRVAADVPLVVTEGNYLLHEEHGWDAVALLLDEVWYLDIDDHERARRLVERRLSHGDDPVRARHWVAMVDEPNARLVAASRERADLVIRLRDDLPDGQLRSAGEGAAQFASPSLATSQRQQQ